MTITEKEMGEPPLSGLNKTEFAALRECSEWPSGMNSHWKPATMKKLAAKGLVVLRPARLSWHLPSWVLTDAGRNLLQGHAVPGSSNTDRGK